MQVIVKVGSQITLPFGDVANITSNNSAIGVAAAPNGGIILTAAQPGEASVTVKISAGLSTTFIVKVV